MIDQRKMAWGILGTGNIARQFCSGLTVCKRGFAAAVGSRRERLAADFAKKFGIPKSYAGYEQVLADSQVNAVYISLPNSMHCEWTIRALQAGKHVLCEKPIASNEAEAERMFEAARLEAKVLVEAFMYRAHPQTQQVITKIQSSAVGKVKLIRTSFCYQTNRIAGNIRFDRLLSGGALMDIGCYCINFSQMVAGANAVDVSANAIMHENGVDEVVVAQMKFENGILASFTCGMTLHADNTAHICGTEGYIEIPRPWKPPVEGAKYWIKASAPVKPDVGKLDSAPGHEFIVSAGIDSYALEADDFASTVMDGKKPMVSESESLVTMRILDEMRRQIGGT
jgi:xylose dehydrogenase (NAD/NADP)